MSEQHNYLPPTTVTPLRDEMESKRARSTNGLAIAGFVLSLLWFYGIGSIIAIIFGAIAMRQTSERGQAGHGLAVTALILGILGLVVTVIVIVAMAGADSSSTVDYNAV